MARKRSLEVWFLSRNKLCLHLECFMHGEVWGSVRPLWKTLTDIPRGVSGNSNPVELMMKINH